MAALLDHHIVHARDPERSARFMTEVLGLPAPTHFGPFVVVTAGNGVSLDFLGTDDPVYLVPNHYAFRVTEDEFDQVFGRIRERGLEHWADPGKQQPGRINHHDGGRGVYWCDPDGHLLEIITRPYGSGAGPPPATADAEPGVADGGDLPVDPSTGPSPSRPRRRSRGPA